MTDFEKTLYNLDELIVKPDAREVVIGLVSCMCDNKKILHFKKGADGDFKMNLQKHAFSSLQIPFHAFELEWAADEQDWSHVFNIINTGTSRVEWVRSR